MSDDALTDSGFDRLMDGIFRLERSIMRIGTIRLTRWNMTLSAYTAMRVVERNPNLSLAQLSRRCYVRPQTMTRIVATLQERGLMARSQSAHSQRAMSLRLTEEGVAAMREMDREVLKLGDSFTAALSADQLEQLTDLLLTAARQVEQNLRDVSAN